MPAAPELPLAAAEADAISLLGELIRCDTTNAGDRPETVGELAAAEFCAEVLREVGYEPEPYTTVGPARAGLVLRIPGQAPGSADNALLLHGHLDVVPADPRAWTHPPFAGRIAPDPVSGEQMLWGRGAVDMKHQVATSLAVLRHWARAGQRPRRDVVLLLLPDEEAGGRKGSHWLVEHRREVFAGVTEAVGEVGGFSTTLPDGTRRYLVQTAEKGIAWLRLRATGTPGHGSMLNDDNAVTTLAEVVSRLGNLRFPLTLTPTTAAQLAALGVPDAAELGARHRELARIVGATLRNTVTPTVLHAGNKVNVIPGEAFAEVDGRFLPGGNHEQELLAAVDQVLGTRVTREFINHDIAVETTFDGPTIAAMATALQAEDPAAQAIPYMLSGGTDAKAFSTLGIRCYGFAPLQLPAGLDFGALFHGVDERVPLTGVRFGVRVLDRFLRTA
ncbi:MAG: M20/M25/M40 family metallo-hydrolase [Candidatus Nanopelagicales bacterium]